MIEKILIGYRKFTSKAGKACCIVSLESDYSEFDIQHGAFGKKCDDVFLPEDCHGLVTVDKIGKTCFLSYGEGYNGTPRVTGIEFQK